MATHLASGMPSVWFVISPSLDDALLHSPCQWRGTEWAEYEQLLQNTANEWVLIEVKK
jgi:hypothetical protein